MNIQEVDPEDIQLKYERIPLDKAGNKSARLVLIHFVGPMRSMKFSFIQSSCRIIAVV